MKNNKLLIGFIGTLLAAILLRVFIMDVISVSNDLLNPHFYPGDFLLVSKLSGVEEGRWVLLKDHPQKSGYSIRKVIGPQSDQGWLVLEPSGEVQSEEKAFVDRKKIVGQVVLILWSLPCKPALLVKGLCPDKAGRFLKVVH